MMLLRRQIIISYFNVKAYYQIAKSFGRNAVTERTLKRY